MNKLYVGIDVGSRDNAVYIMLPDGSKHSAFAVKNNLGGAKTISDRTIKALTETGMPAVVIGMEATSVYGDNLLYFLREDGALGRFDRSLHVLNPKHFEKFRDALPYLPKNDAVDAFVIADNLRHGRIARAVYLNDYRYKALQTLTRARYHAVQSLTREKQRFAQHLFLKCSGLAQNKIFSDNFGAAALAVFEEFEYPDELSEITVDELAAFIATKGKNRSPRPEELAEAVQAAVRGSYRIPKTICDSVNQVLSISISTMRAIKRKSKLWIKRLNGSSLTFPTP